MSLSENPTRIALDFGFRPKPKTRGDTLVSLWRAARSNAENAPACPCHGIIAGRVDPDTLETNMLTPLRTRYRDAGRKDLRDVIELRLRKSPFAGMRKPFESWLLDLNNAALTEDEKTILCDDLEAALQYHAEMEPVFICT